MQISSHLSSNIATCLILELAGRIEVGGETHTCLTHRIGVKGENRVLIKAVGLDGFRVSERAASQRYVRPRGFGLKPL